VGLGDEVDDPGRIKQAAMARDKTSTIFMTKLRLKEVNLSS